MSEKNLIAQPLPLPCGAVLKNRLFKSAMSDSLGDGKGNATATQARLYERWAAGGAALALIGEVQVDARYPEKPGNLVLSADADMPALRTLAQRGGSHGAHLWTQLGHAGALAHPPISRPKGPSALNVDGLQCEAMTATDIAELPGRYAAAATIARDVGFGGVQIHSGHGFLLSQFLSPLFNHRGDAYGGGIQSRFRIIDEIIAAVRTAVGDAFPVGIKMNATDKLAGGLTPTDALAVVKLLNNTSVDLIEISGGTYFPGAAAASDNPTVKPYFADFAERAKEVTTIPVAATGGFETLAQAHTALAQGSVDAVGLARALALAPALPQQWLSNNTPKPTLSDSHSAPTLDSSHPDPTLSGSTLDPIPDGSHPDPTFPVFSSPPPGSVTAWYTMRLTALGEDTENEYTITPAAAQQLYETRDHHRASQWQTHFPHHRKTPF